MNFIEGSVLEELLRADELISALQASFAQGSIYAPDRHHHTIKQPVSDATLLLMPAWQKKYLGVKVVSVFPENSQTNALDTIQGTYLLMDGTTGRPLISMDAKVLTNLRTAATSALAGKLLQTIANGTMLMIGTGSLAPYLIEAHHAVHDFKEIRIAGRSLEKAERIKQLAEDSCPNVQIKIVQGDEGRAGSDLISVATLARDPVLYGTQLEGVSHVDLVGAYTPEMREADDELIKQAHVYIDTWRAIEETGDLAIPLQSGVLLRSDIKGTLRDLCLGKGSLSENGAMTVFKSVGHASEDLVAAILAYEKFMLW